MPKEQKRKQQIGLNNGSALILVLFSVLCLTVLAALSLLSANSEWALAQRSADAMTQYYEADRQAVEIYELLRDGSFQDERLPESLTAQRYEYFNESEGKNVVGYRYEYSVAINEQQELVVQLRRTGEQRMPTGPLEIIGWKAVESGDWEPELELPVWDGEFAALPDGIG